MGWQSMRACEEEESLLDVRRLETGLRCLLSAARVGEHVVSLVWACQWGLERSNATPQDNVKGCWQVNEGRTDRRQQSCDMVFSLGMRFGALDPSAQQRCSTTSLKNASRRALDPSAIT
jgi:hypothetical protein